VLSVIRFLNAKGERQAEIHKQIVAGSRAQRFPLASSPKKHLAGKNFDDVDEVQEEAMTWFKGQAADFYDSGIQKLVPRLNKHLDQWRTEGGVGGSPPRNCEDIGAVLDRMSKKNRRLDFLL